MYSDTFNYMLFINSFITLFLIPCVDAKCKYDAKCK